MRSLAKRNNIGFTLVELMIVVGIIALLSAIAIPNIIRSRINANEAAAQSLVKSIIGAAQSYRAVNPDYPSELKDLGDCVPPYLSDAVCADANSNGYDFALSGDNYTFEVTASPEVVNETGVNSFYGDESGVVISVTPEEIAAAGGLKAAAWIKLGKGGEEEDEGLDPDGRDPINPFI